MNNFLTIAASDNSGGAGIQQDIKIAEKIGFWGLSAITGITVQDFSGTDAIFPIPANILSQQLEKNFKSFEINATKIGVVSSDENIQIISDFLKKYILNNVVLDPVFAPSHGISFIGSNSINLYKEKILPYIKVITPNKKELELLTDKKNESFEEGIDTAQNFSKQFHCCVYIKGGHFEGDTLKEALIDENKIYLFEKKRRELKYSHGTGCTFSTALSCFLANGLSIEKACEKATAFVDKIFL